MHNIMVAGAGKIGSLITCLLSQTNDYDLHLVDLDFKGSDVSRLFSIMPKMQHASLDVTDLAKVEVYLKKHHIDAIISSLPFYLNPKVALAAKNANCHYFDLTEDVAVTHAVKDIAKGAVKAFVPQCGVAPGMVNIIASSLIQMFENTERVSLRVGALPQRSNNPFHYSLTWSTDGLINEYANLCCAIREGKMVTLNPLEDLETVHLNGETYEAFNTSGGLGSLTTLYQNKIKHLNYKTLRYPGHCEKMRFLMKEMNFSQNREGLKKLLEQLLPKTYQDLVIIYVSVEGIEQGVLSEKSWLNKIYPNEIAGLTWSAIQISTAFGLCSLVDLVMDNESLYQGLILQETFNLDRVLANRFGKLFKGL